MFHPKSANLEGLKLIGTVPPESLRGKRVLVRCDFNVDVSSSGEILNTLRIEKTYKTINYLKNSGAKIILISHIGRTEEDTLRPIFNYLSKVYKLNFIEDIYDNTIEDKFSEMGNGDMFLIENLRKWDGEKKNNDNFSKMLGGFANLFVNEAFSSSHRDHASITGVPKYLPTYIGFQFKDEIENLSKAFDAEHPFLAIIGGAKFQTKLGVIESLEDQADLIFVGGALANDIYRVQGYEVGGSSVSNLGKSVIERMLSSQKIASPIDVKTVNNIGFLRTKKPSKIKTGEKIIDGGPKTARFLKKKIKESKMVVWNGPLGLYEKGYDYLTRKVAKQIARSDTFSIVGGGDTVVEITNMGMEEKFNFVSMAGGAMLEFIAKGTLVGIDAIKQK